MKLVNIGNPKPPKIKLSDKKKHELRIALYNVYGEHCPKCMAWREFNQMHLHHIKRRGAGGDDRLNNLSWECFECHDRDHR